MCRFRSLFEQEWDRFAAGRCESTASCALDRPSPVFSASSRLLAAASFAPASSARDASSITTCNSALLRPLAAAIMCFSTADILAFFASSCDRGLDSVWSVRFDLNSGPLDLDRAPTCRADQGRRVGLDVAPAETVDGIDGPRSHGRAA